MPPTTAIVWGVVFPLVISAVAWLMWYACQRRAPESRWGGILAASGVGGAFLFAFFAVDPFVKFPPLLAPDWLFYSAIVIILVASAEGLAGPVRWYWKLAFWVVAAGVAVVPVSGAWRGGLDGEGNARPFVLAWAAVGGWMVLAVGLRVALGRLGCASPNAGVWVLGLTSAVSAVVLGLSGSQFTMPFRTASLGLSLLPLVPLMWFSRKSESPLPLPSPALTVWGMLTAGVLLTGYLWYELTAVNALLLALGAVVAAVIPTGPAWPRVVGGLVPALVALALAAVAFARAQSGDGSGY